MVGILPWLSQLDGATMLRAGLPPTAYWSPRPPKRGAYQSSGGLDPARAMLRFAGTSGFFHRAGSLDGNSLLVFASFDSQVPPPGCGYERWQVIHQGSEQCLLTMEGEEMRVSHSGKVQITGEFPRVLFGPPIHAC